MKKIIVLIACMAAISVTAQDKKWAKEKADAWYASHKWISGANFIPSNAINQLEMWQAETFAPETIDRELGYAQSVGFNTMRVFLHSMAYKADKKGFKQRVEKYLTIADKHGIQTMFVFFDDCWNATPQIGTQPAPKPGVHNSGWVQDPGFPASEEMANSQDLEAYVKDILTTFGKDKRILLWDLYNEPGNNGKGMKTMELLKNTFKWAREAAPEQPLSAGLWKWDYQELNTFQAQNSDIITYHCYGIPEEHQRIINLLKTHNLPIICTEYMARTRNNNFANTMTLLKKENIGAINWGLVNGKSNTIYAWSTPIESGDEPDEWFHDLFRKDGTPYREDETRLIKKLNE